MGPAVGLVVEDAPGAAELLADGADALVVDGAADVVVELEGVLDADEVAVADFFFLCSRVSAHVVQPPPPFG